MKWVLKLSREIGARESNLVSGINVEVIITLDEFLHPDKASGTPRGIRKWPCLSPTPGGFPYPANSENTGR